MKTIPVLALIAAISAVSIGAISMNGFSAIPFATASVNPESGTMMGHVEYVLRDSDGNIKSYVQGDNIVVNKGDDCIDSKNNKSEFFDSDDYCFIIQLEERNVMDTLFNKQDSFIIQGDLQSKNIEELKKIKVKEFVGIGTMSDKEDKYSAISHASYEFKIPIELIGRSDNYGFYVNVFDANSNVVYSWPEEIKLESFGISNPSLWGNLISPDKSLLENSESESMDFIIPFVIVFVISAIILFVIFKKIRSSKEIK